MYVPNAVLCLYNIQREILDFKNSLRSSVMLTIKSFGIFLENSSVFEYTYIGLKIQLMQINFVTKYKQFISKTPDIFQVIYFFARAQNNQQKIKYVRKKNKQSLKYMHIKLVLYICILYFVYCKNTYSNTQTHCTGRGVFTCSQLKVRQLSLIAIEWYQCV